MVDDAKIVSVKSTLCTPYSIEWPLLQKGVTPEILNAFQRTFEPLKGKLGKLKTRGQKSKRHAKEKEGNCPVSDDNTNIKQDRSLRSHILIGVNEVTRALERGLLRSVVVCRSTKPSHMTNHLLTLSATRKTPALCIFRLSEVLSPLLNLKTVMAIGFKKTNGENTEFDDLVEMIIKRTPQINLPWLQEQKISLEALEEGHPKVTKLKVADKTSKICGSAEKATATKRTVTVLDFKLDRPNPEKIAGSREPMEKPGVHSKNVKDLSIDKEIKPKVEESLGEAKSNSNKSTMSQMEVDTTETINKKSSNSMEISESPSVAKGKRKKDKSKQTVSGVKRTIDESLNEPKNKQQKTLTSEAGYVEVKIDKVKVIPKESKSKKKKKGKKPKGF